MTPSLYAIIVAVIGLATTIFKLWIGKVKNDTDHTKAENEKLKEEIQRTSNRPHTDADIRRLFQLKIAAAKRREKNSKQ